MDTSFDEWLTMENIPECPPNYCDEENGIFWGEYTETERQYVAKLAEGLATRSADNSIIIPQIDDHSIYDGMVPKDYSIISSIEPMNISENMSPFVSSFGSTLVSKDSPLQKTPIVEKLSDKTIDAEVTTDEMLSDKTIGAEVTTDKSNLLMATRSADNSIIIPQTDDHSIYDGMVPKDYSIISSIEPMNISENMSPFVSSFGSTLVSKDSPLQKTPIVEKLSDKTIDAEVTTDEMLSDKTIGAEVTTDKSNLLMATRSADNSIIIPQTDDHSIYDGMVPKDYSIISSIEPMNISGNMSLFVSSFGSTLVSKDIPLQKTPIVERLSDKTIDAEVTTDEKLSDKTIDAEVTTDKSNLLMATRSADNSIIIPQTDDHSIYDGMVPKDYSIISSIEPMNISKNMSPFVSSFGSTLLSKDSLLLKTPIVEKLSDKTIGVEVTTDKSNLLMTTRSADNSIIIAQTDDHSIYDGMVPKDYSIISSIEPMNISENMSPFVSSFGSSLVSKESPLQKTPIVEKLSDKTISAEVTTHEFNLLMNDSINTNEKQMQNYFLKPSQEKHILDQTIEIINFDSKSIFDNSIEMTAKDLLSPFCLNKNSVKSSANEIPVTSSLVSLDTPTVRPLRRSTVGKVESTMKSRIPKDWIPLQTRRQTRSSTKFNSSLNESTLDFILNEIKCNTEDTEEFLTKD